MSKFWSLPVITAYLYGITILTQYGYNSYFNIPTSFIESSITSNFVYFFQLFQLATAIGGVIQWWMWAIVIIGLLTILFFYFYHFVGKYVIISVGFVVLLIFLYQSYDFGMLLAKSNSEFYVPTGNCSSLDTNIRYVIPHTYGGDIILVPIDESNKMIGGILVKDFSELGCVIEKKNIGLITR